MEETDARLVERSRAGDAAAFERLVRRHLSAAYAVALAIVGDASDAEDVCQDAFVSALERLDSCRRPDLFAHWLGQIVRNRARDLLRAQGVRRALPLAAAEHVAGGSSPLRETELAQLRAHLLESLAVLSEVQREVVLLHDLEGLRHREIAARLGIAEGTSRSLLFKARHALRAKIRQEG